MIPEMEMLSIIRYINEKEKNKTKHHPYNWVKKLLL